ncbi:MAG: hypothetical protein AB7H97_04030 [Pseudobdellovibrionaceae bacterium]
MSKHTPGPWVSNENKYSDGSIGIGPKNEKTDVARAFYSSDANLIAAAPDMLEALQGFVRQFESGVLPRLACEKAKEAILKATGGTK